MNYTLITGACGGLGRAFTELAAKNKENLILTGTSEKKLSALLEEFKNLFSEISVKTYVCDLGSLKDREELVNNISSEGLTVSRLINNAGVILEGDLERFSDAEIMNVIQVNCIGTLDLTKKLLRQRNKDELFEVLTIASVAASYPIPHMAVYAATKSFLVSIMTSLGEEFKGQKVTFTTVLPGGMATNEAMKQSIKSMGLGGKLSCTDTIKVAKISLMALKRRKVLVVAGGFNKFLDFISKPFSKKFLAKNAGKLWKKSQKKRGFWYVFIIFLKNRVDKNRYIIIMYAMKQINTNETNIFSKSIVEIKLIADRIAEGKGEEAGIFSNMHQILYILNKQETVTPRELIMELNIAKSNLAILAKKMIKDGYIESHKDKINKREIFYNITDLGREVLAKKLNNIDTVCTGDAKKVVTILSRAIDELRKIEEEGKSNGSGKKRKTNAK